jgi:2-succinyl-5-enolpyruvyl-6-hydroxy-3-cyclohexene-1-carboxylate synthase
MEAREGGTPLIAITADRPAELHGFGAPQTIEQHSMFGGYVRDRLSLPEPFEQGLTHVAAALSKLVHTACSRPRGGVHLNTPFREPLAHPDGLSGPIVTPAVPRFMEARGVPELGEIVQVVQRATRGVIIAGPRERDDGFGAALQTLGEALGFPVFAEAGSNARFGFEGSTWAFDAMLRSSAFAAKLAPDVVLRFGGGLTLKTPQQWLDASRARVFAFLDEGQPFDPHHAVEAFFTGDVVAMIGALTQRGAGTLRPLVAQAQARVDALLRSREVLDEPGVARTVAAALPAGANLVMSSSMPVRDVDAFAAAGARPRRVFSNRGVNGIDGVISTAVGVARASAAPTVLLIGDVAALHDLGGWVAAKGAALTVVVVNNDGGGIFSFLPVAERTPHFERFFGTPHGTDFGHVAALAGAQLHRPRTLAQLSATLEVTTRAGLHLIEVRTERRANVEAHRQLNAALVAAVEASS